MRIQRCSLFTLLGLLLNSVIQSAEWNGSEKWDLFDCPERRAMWVWNPAAVTGTKAENRYWDPTPSAPRNAQARFFENYKGSQDLFFDFCENKSIRVLYFYNAVWEWNLADLDNATPTIPNEADFASLVAEANSRGIQVWLMCYLWDDPNDSRMTIPAQKQSIKRLAEAVHNFNTAHPTTPVAGIHVDQEPGNVSVYDDLLDTMKIAQDWVDVNSPEIMISQALRPRWRNENVTWNGVTKPMNEHIMDTIGHGAYMSYNDNVNTVKNWLTPIINHATSKNKKISSGFEVNDLTGLWANSDEETWWEEIGNEPLATRFKVDAAAPVTFEDAMHDIVASYQAQAGYDRQVIHSYSGYFKHWFGEHPRDYILNLPAGEYVSATQNPAKVNLHQDTRELVGISKFIGAPTAQAGADQVIFDTDGQAGESVTLDASASSDSDGTIVSYEWKENGVVIGNIKNPTVNLTDGVHTITLSVTDNHGKTSMDTVVVTVNEVSVTLNDSDGNGLNDDWEIAHFGGIGTVGYSLDTDRDGFTTFEEMVFGLDPNVRDPANAHVSVQMVDDAGTKKLEFKFRRPLNYVALEVIYQLETSTDLSVIGVGKWTEDNTATPTYSDDGVIQWVTYLLPAELGKAFYRCKVKSTTL